MGVYQIMGSPVSCPGESGIYPVSDKGLLKIFNQGESIVHFFWHA